MVLNAVFNGNFLEGVQFLFSPDFSQISPNTFLSAMGQAFFSMSLGMGAIMTYGAYMSDNQKITQTLKTFLDQIMRTLHIMQNMVTEITGVEEEQAQERLQIGLLLEQ